MISAFMTVSGYTFWAILLAVVIIDTAFLSADDNEVPAIVIAMTAVLAAVLFTDAFTGVKIATLIAALFSYLALGVLWSFKKWWSYVVDCKKTLRKNYDDFAHKDAKGNETFESYSANKQPTAANHKQHITAWMILWPFSFSWWIVTWPRRAFVWIYDRLSTLYDRISAHIWASA